MKQLTRKEKKRIIRKVNVDKVSVSDMAKEYGRDRSTINVIVKRGTPDRVSKVDKSVKKEIIRIVTGEPDITSEGIHALLDCNVSISSINKCLVRSGFTCQSKKGPVRERLYDSPLLPERDERIIVRRGSRRAYKLDGETKSEIMAMVAENPLCTATMIQASIGKHLAISTINGFLRKNGFGCACKKIPNRA